jgi:methyltransferase (TIGR00027 family)
MARPSTSGGDPEGEARLNVDLGADPGTAPGPLFHHLAARTRFFDEVTLAAVEGGTTQIVVVGAGYDCRALRFRRRGVRYFELDHPATQRDKQERLARLGIAATDVSYVAIDLTAQDVDASLETAGHDAAQPSLFLCEGLLLYLDVAVVERLFRGLRCRVHGDATMALSLAVSDRAVAETVVALRRAAWHRRLRSLGEPPRTTLRREEWDALLLTSGWAPQRAVDPHEIDPKAAAGGSLLVIAGPVPWT